MSEIPFVSRFGDALESAIATPSAQARRPFRGPRRALLAVALVAIGATGVAVAQITGDPVDLAVNNVACYHTADLDGGDVSVLSADGRSPISVCAEALSADGRGSAPPLVACANGAGVAVLPGHGTDTCGQHGLDPLPAGYDPARNRIGALEQRIATLERATDCIPPHDLARKAQAILDDGGWAGWRAVVGPQDLGPCGWIRRLGGARASLSPALRPATGELVVTTGPPHALHEQLLGEGSIGARVVDASGSRCFTVSELQDHARDELAPTGLDIQFRVAAMPATVGIETPLGDRYAEGCAIALGAYPVYPSEGAIAVEVEILHRARGARSTEP